MPMRTSSLIARGCAERFTVDGESAARYIKSTNSRNTNTPIIAISAYGGTDSNEGNSLFAASLSKPLQKADLIGKLLPCLLSSQDLKTLVAVMRQLGFKTTKVALEQK